ncbi:glycosyltransferase family 4 protein [Dehalococcoidia bacterium]|nr:glycosyltransferase family 4 protein [Dehalococcoidia bacterium]
MNINQYEEKQPPVNLEPLGLRPGSGLTTSEEYISANEFKYLYEQARRTSPAVRGFINYLKKYEERKGDNREPDNLSSYCKTKVACSLRICVVNFPFRPGIDSHIPLLNLLEILKLITDDICVITSNFFPQRTFHSKIQIHNVNLSKSRTMIFPLRILRNISTQVIFSGSLVKNAKEAYIIVFFGTSTFILPLLSAVLMGKRTLLIITTSERKMAGHVSEQDFWNKISTIIVLILENLVCKLSSRIATESPNLVYERRLERYENKIFPKGSLFVDTNLFKSEKNLGELDNLVGYIGRLSEEKGVLNFARAIPEIYKERADVEFLVVGDGHLRDKLEEYLDEEKLNNKVKLLGWVPHDELAKYLNNLKLFVLPSYTEGLPNIMLEAMACGTPVLATSVGAIPDVIKDGETGFILENNSPECIAENVIRALNHPNLEKIARNARALIEKEFTYEKAVERYRNILEELL